MCSYAWILALALTVEGAAAASDVCSLDSGTCIVIVAEHSISAKQVLPSGIVVSLALDQLGPIGVLHIRIQNPTSSAIRFDRDSVRLSSNNRQLRPTSTRDAVVRLFRGERWAMGFEGLFLGLEQGRERPPTKETKEEIDGTFTAQAHSADYGNISLNGNYQGTARRTEVDKEGLEELRTRQADERARFQHKWHGMQERINERIGHFESRGLVSTTIEPLGALEGLLLYKASLKGKPTEIRMPVGDSELRFDLGKFPKR